MKNLTAKILVALLLSFHPFNPLYGSQFTLVFTTDGEASTELYPNLDDEELLVMVPGSTGVEMFLDDFNWTVILGDCNQDRHWNDSFSEIDGIALSPSAGSQPSIYEFYLSVNSSKYLTSGVKIYDGDIFRLLPGGSAEVLYSEEQLLSSISSTSEGDIDGFAFPSSGGLLFTFDDIVVTWDPHLQEENGGSAVLEDETVFFLPAGSSRASILFTAEQMRSMVNNALGMDLTGIKDVQGLDMDPEHPGEILFSTGICSGPGHTTLFSSAFGGSIARINGLDLRPESFSFNDPEDINSIALLPGSYIPLSLDLEKSNPSLSRDGEVVLYVNGGTPGALVRILVSHAVLPVINPLYVPALQGTPYLFENIRDSLFSMSVVSIHNCLTLNGQGRGALGLPIGVHSVGKKFFLQAVEIDSLKASYGVAIEIEP